MLKILDSAKCLSEALMKHDIYETYDMSLSFNVYVYEFIIQCLILSFNFLSLKDRARSHFNFKKCSIYNFKNPSFSKILHSSCPEVVGFLHVNLYHHLHYSGVTCVLVLAKGIDKPALSIAILVNVSVPANP